MEGRADAIVTYKFVILLYKVSAYVHEDVYVAKPPPNTVAFVQPPEYGQDHLCIHTHKHIIYLNLLDTIHVRDNI